MNNINKAELIKLLPDFYSYLLAVRDVSSSTHKHHASNIKLILAETSSFDKLSIINFIALEKQRVSRGTVENYIYTIRVICEFLIDRGIFNYNWGKDIPLPKREYKVPVILSSGEIEKILNVDLPNSYSKHPDPLVAQKTYDLILNLLARTGARVGEVLSIRVEDLDMVRGTWNLKHSKTRRGRIIPIPPDLTKEINRLTQNKGPTDYLFINGWSKQVINQVSLGNNLRMRVVASGVKKRVSLHTFRHSFITELLRQDVSILKIANIVGHENIKTTQDYAKLLYEDLQDAILRHPLTAKKRNPYDILKHIKENIEKFRLKEDPRFMVNIEDGNDGIRVSIFIR